MCAGLRLAATLSSSRVPAYALLLTQHLSKGTPRALKNGDSDARRLALAVLRQQSDVLPAPASFGNGWAARRVEEITQTLTLGTEDAERMDTDGSEDDLDELSHILALTPRLPSVPVTLGSLISGALSASAPRRSESVAWLAAAGMCDIYESRSTATK